MQIISPLAPLSVATHSRIQGITLWLSRFLVVACHHLFVEFLYQAMTYSCALLTQLPTRTSRWRDLAATQRRKINRLLNMAGV
ncbi:hypothetical protein DIJ64_13060 [Mycobacterium leprae]|uniref:U1740ad n=1 Tax=Mycobacterium leprae TaxID=1769 RepID=Q50088_MYCLR|nr:u1740ad [Mycobacterium leprae]AWV48654.1 hypothetical protein DIJ64_13060 [Mycobacterium leprae]OAR19619.1 hypothetical protein A8144_13910 [Mycobacterium leprae 3125609]OAX70131.1 hypothetical protein A3216_13825 [Mycobacterium leprae 7935681]